ncbi:MAG: hypothetical protein L0210_04450 [Rhodospirillales bacterium]|nr:hypothetical protein [Rhodospirillales bacterium]
MQLIVRDDAIVATEPVDEGNMPRRAQPDHLAVGPAVAVQQKCQPERGLARCTRQDNRTCPKEVRLGEEVVEQEGRGEQRPKEHLLILVLHAVARVIRNPGVLVVHRRKRLPMRRGVDEIGRFHSFRLDDYMRGHG